MNTKRITLFFILLLSICFAYSQESVVQITVVNSSDYDYILTAKFNQNIVPNTGNNPFDVPANSTVTEIFEFWYDADVNLDELKCYWDHLPIQTPIGIINTNSSVGTTVHVAPTLFGATHVFEYFSQGRTGIYDISEFHIYF